MITRTASMVYSLKKNLLLVLLFSVVPYISAAPFNFNGLIGVDYQPNHYAGKVPLNNHDVFVVGNNTAGTPITNVYTELVQLKEAGFNTVRSYQTTVFSWVEIINQAHALGMKVIYEAAIPQRPADSLYNGACPFHRKNQNAIPCAQETLNAVITQVTKQVFDETVILVFAGHENYCEAGNTKSPCNNPATSNVTYLTSAVNALQSTLAAAGLTTPVSSALVSGNLVTPSMAISNDMMTLIDSYSPDAPLAFDPYPFQWGVQANKAVWTPPLASIVQSNNSLAWDYIHVVGSSNPKALPTASKQPFYTAGRVLLAAETGWATAGKNPSDDQCNTPGPCVPSVANASTYYKALYQSNTANFVATSGYSMGVLAFEAYDEPNKGSSSTEGHYGLFDSNCQQKAAGLVPKNQMVSSLGCQGFSKGSLLTIVGGFGHPHTIVIRQKNPITGKDASITATGQDREGPLDAKWPQYLVFPGATITIRGNPSCTKTVNSIDSAGHITFYPPNPSGCNCPNDGLSNCYY
ncbi:glycosyl hydrolase family 17 protein [Legionella wadsworthii]|nr:glycosyl hydrolase family 17 protein [Legionella wadsworthii]